MPRQAQKPKTEREAKFYRIGYLAGYGAKRNAATKKGEKPKNADVKSVKKVSPKKRAKVAKSKAKSKAKKR